MTRSISPRKRWPPLAISFYERPVVEVAHDLLGKLLVRRTDEACCVGRIVEVEAYLANDDSACHAARGKTRKNASMFGPAGRAYVYAIHSRWCFNVVTERENSPSAVLIRAMEPLSGLEAMHARRHTAKPIDLARGPARLCEALAIDRDFDGWNLTLGRALWIADDPDFLNAANSPRTLASPRIGVTSAQDKHLRFFHQDSRYVSGPRYWHNAGR